MATNRASWIRNMNGAKFPEKRLGLFQAGSTQAIKVGEILELSSSNWIPLDANQSMAGVIAIAAEEIKAGDLAGYYWIIVPRPGDVFEYALDTANDVTEGTSLYWSDSQTLTETAGSGNVLCYSVGQRHFPAKQNHLGAAGELVDSGTTLKVTSYVEVVFKLAVSYYVALVK